MFILTKNKGFHITFKNGCTISVQFGSHNYCGNYPDSIFFKFGQKDQQPEKGVEDCEIAIWDKNDKWITREICNNDDDVMGFVKPDELLKIMNKVAKRKKA
jgi:hypothetical protein